MEADFTLKTVLLIIIFACFYNTVDTPHLLTCFFKVLALRVSLEKTKLLSHCVRLAVFHLKRSSSL
jgi:hypothetical protein